MRLLALDISSTNVGVAVFDDDVITAATSYAALGNLQARLVKLSDIMHELLRMQPDYLAIEAPAYSRFEHVALQRAAGAMLCHWRGGAVLEVAPNTAKSALTGRGNAGKAEMIRAARWWAPGRELDSHSADAVGIGLAAIARLKSEDLSHQEALNA